MLRLTSEPRGELSRPADNVWGNRSDVSAWRRAGARPWACWSRESPFRSGIPGMDVSWPRPEAVS